jgi:hypothetical protein
VTDVEGSAGPISARREFTIVFVLGLLAVSMIAVASATSSYVPLFIAWIPYLGIPFTISRSDRARAGSVAPPQPSPDDSEDEGSGEDVTANNGV